MDAPAAAMAARTEWAVETVPSAMVACVPRKPCGDTSGTFATPQSFRQCHLSGDHACVKVADRELVRRLRECGVRERTEDDDDSLALASPTAGTTRAAMRTRSPTRGSSEQ